MERRQSERIIIGFNADIRHKAGTFSGVLENLSENGVCVISYAAELNLEALEGENVKLKMSTVSGETLTIKCKVSCTAKVMPHKLASRIGFEIIDSPWELSSFIL